MAYAALLLRAHCVRLHYHFMSTVEKLTHEQSEQLLMRTALLPHHHCCWNLRAFQTSCGSGNLHYGRHAFSVCGTLMLRMSMLQVCGTVPSWVTVHVLCCLTVRHCSGSQHTSSRYTYTHTVESRAIRCRGRCWFVASPGHALVATDVATSIHSPQHILTRHSY